MLKNNSLIQYTGITVLSFVIISIYGLLAFNLKVFSPVAKAIGDYSFEDFYYQILGASAEVDTNRVVTIVDMTELYSRRDLANTISEISSLKPKVLGVDIVFEGLAVGLVVFLVVAVFVWMGFMLFCEYNISINLGFAIAATAVIPSAINLYDTIVNYKK